MLSLIISGCNTSTNDFAGWQTITHEEYNFSIDYPSRWKAITYGENGKRGNEVVKLSVYSTVIGDLWISVRQNADIVEPNLEDVLMWSNERISDYRRDSIKYKEDPDQYFEEIFLEEDEIDEHPIMRRRYQLGTLLREEVYIARETDMIIIVLQNPEASFDYYLDDFDRMVNSFTPLE